ncbi:MAG: hypothetical protein ABSA52_00550 [Candidatus Binatia bacterium]|jgi:hypothetical protein
MTAPVDAAGYANFLRELGHRVVQTRSNYWYDASRFFFLSAPPHRVYDPPEEEIRAVLRRLPCMGLRFAAPIEGHGKLSYQIVCDNPGYSIEALSANVRSKVRRGLKRCEVGPIPFSVIATAGRQAHYDTLARQGRDGVLTGESWDKFWAAAGATEGFEGWAAWSGSELAAFLVTVTFEDAVEFMLARSCSNRLGAYPNNALLFYVTEEMLVRRRVPAVTFGLESLEPVGPLDQFKFAMGFRPRSIRQRVVFHPLVRILLRRGVVRTLFRRLTDHRGTNAVFWRKAAGLLRFAEEGGL